MKTFGRIKAMELDPAEEIEPCETAYLPEELDWPEPEPEIEMPVTSERQRKTSNVVLAILALFLLAFIVTMIAVFCVKGSVPDTLIQYTMGAGGLEALLLAGIKVSKVLTGGRPGSDGSEDGAG